MLLHESSVMGSGQSSLNDNPHHKATVNDSAWFSIIFSQCPGEARTELALRMNCPCFPLLYNCGFRSQRSMSGK